MHTDTLRKDSIWLSQCWLQVSVPKHCIGHQYHSIAASSTAQAQFFQHTPLMYFSMIKVPIFNLAHFWSWSAHFKGKISYISPIPDSNAIYLCGKMCLSYELIYSSWKLLSGDKFVKFGEFSIRYYIFQS